MSNNNHGGHFWGAWGPFGRFEGDQNVLDELETQWSEAQHATAGLRRPPYFIERIWYDYLIKSDLYYNDKPLL